MRNGIKFRGGDRAQVPSLPVDDPLTSDEKGVYFPYTPAPLGASPYRLSTETSMSGNRSEPAFPRNHAHVS